MVCGSSNRQTLRRLINRVGDIVDVLVRVEFIPRKYQHAFERLECPLKFLRAVVNGFRPRQRERETALTERALIAKDFAHEGGLLNITRSRRDALLFQEPSHA